jgi:hypothetical protein
MSWRNIPSGAAKNDMTAVASMAHRIFPAALILLMVFLFFAPNAFAGNPAFESIETQTLDEQAFMFPNDLRAGKLNIVMLAISEEQDNGTWQGEALLDWYAELTKAGILSSDIVAWHFSVLKVPFFVKGLVRGGMADSYKGKIPLDQASAMFVKDVGAFAKSADIVLDGQPTIILVSAEGELLDRFKGAVSEAQLAKVVEAVKARTTVAAENVN